MTLKETALVVALLREYYPRDAESTDVQAKVKAWHLAFVDYPLDAVKAAVVAFAANDTKGFAPVPGQIVEEINRGKRPMLSGGGAERRGRVTEKDVIGNIEAWAAVNEIPMPQGMTAREAMDWYNRKRGR